MYHPNQGSSTRKQKDDLSLRAFIGCPIRGKRWGWLKDKFGVSWQIVPTAMEKMMTKGTPEQIARFTEAFLKMKKFDIAKLKEAHDSD